MVRLFVLLSSVVILPSNVLAKIPGLSNAIFQGVAVQTVASNKLLVAHNPDQLLIPASLTKLVTTAAVLDKWGSTHSFVTRVMHSGQRRGNTIKGNLVMVGAGDPYLVSEKMWDFASQVKNLGINRVEGQILIDNGLFPAKVDQVTATSTNAYDAPVTAFGINFNTVTISVLPGTQIGKPAKVTLFPFALDSVQIHNRVVTVANGKGSRVEAVRTRGRSSIKIIVSGRIAIDRRQPLTLYRSINEPQRVASDYVRNFLRQHDVQVLGKKLYAHRRLTPLTTIKGYPLNYIVKGLNTFSNNYIADVLLKKLVPSGNGSVYLQDYLQQQVGIRSKFVLRDGSGLNPDNKLTARQLTTLLTHVAQRMDLFPDFIASLPASGLEGTVSERLADYRGLIRLKTATLSSPFSVSGLAGYYLSTRHGLVAFAILANGRPDRSQPTIVNLRQQQDRLLTYLVNKF